MTDSQLVEPAETTNKHPDESVGAHPGDVSAFLYRGFWKYSRRLVRKRFHALRIARGSVPEISKDEPLLIYGNHASWWDPLVAVLVNQLLLAPREFHAPIDAEALQRYAILRKLGFFPVEQDTAAGTRAFLKTVQRLFDGSTSIFITPQGKFVDVRDQQPFEPGLAHVVSRLNRGTVIPMAVEYTFWDESTPEILLQFGQPVSRSEPSDRSKSDWNDWLVDELVRTQTSLAEKAKARSPEPFESLVGGRVGEGGLYDVARRVKSFVSGRRFVAGHEFPDRPSTGLPDK